MSRIAKGGLTGLPGIYKEMAFAMFVDTMDLRVYSARKGRMWRTCGVARENGAFKVPLTPLEALAMKPEDYAGYCAAPRPEPALAAPILSPKLAVLFEKSKLKIEAASKRKKDSAKDLRLLADFKGEYPPTLARIMRVPVDDGGLGEVAAGDDRELELMSRRMRSPQCQGRRLLGNSPV